MTSWRDNVVDTDSETDHRLRSPCHARSNFHEAVPSTLFPLEQKCQWPEATNEEGQAKKKRSIVMQRSPDTTDGE